MYMEKTEELVIVDLGVDSKTEVTTTEGTGSRKKSQAKPQAEPEEVLMYIEIEVDEGVSIALA